MVALPCSVAGFQRGAYRLPKKGNETGSTFISYGGLSTIAGQPVDDPDGADIRARLIEVTPEKDVVLDLAIGGEADDPKVMSVFRAEWVAA